MRIFHAKTHPEKITNIQGVLKQLGRMYYPSSSNLYSLTDVRTNFCEHSKLHIWGSFQTVDKKYTFSLIKTYLFPTCRHEGLEFQLARKKGLYEHPVSQKTALEGGGQEVFILNKFYRIAKLGEELHPISDTGRLRWRHLQKPSLCPTPRINCTSICNRSSFFTI